MMRPHEVKQTIKAGAFIGILLIVCCVFILMLGQESALFERKISIHAITQSAENLKIGAAVHLKGIKVGTVKDIQFMDLNKMKISFQVVKKVQGFIRKDSNVEIRTLGMLGDKYLEISGGTPKTSHVEDEDTINLHTGVGMKDFLSKGDQLLLSATQAIQKLNGILSDINKDHTLQHTFTNLKDISANMNSIFTKIDESNAVNNLTAFTDSLARVGDKVENGPGTLHSMIFDDSVYEDIRILMGGAQRNKILKYFIRESIKEQTKLSK